MTKLRAKEQWVETRTMLLLNMLVLLNMLRLLEPISTAGGDVPDLDVEEDVAKIPEVWRPPVWPEQGTHSEKYSLPCPCIANALGR